MTTVRRPAHPARPPPRCSPAGVAHAARRGPRRLSGAPRAGRHHSHVQRAVHERAAARRHRRRAGRGAARAAGLRARAERVGEPTHVRQPCGSCDRRAGPFSALAGPARIFFPSVGMQRSGWMPASGALGQRPDSACSASGVRSQFCWRRARCIFRATGTRPHPASRLMGVSSKYACCRAAECDGEQLAAPWHCSAEMLRHACVWCKPCRHNPCFTQGMPPEAAFLGRLACATCIACTRHGASC